MQEPVLFNTSIKENILYGDLDASDEQVLKVAEMSNALAFIESNVEDLDKDQRREKNATDLLAAYEGLVAQRPNIKSLDISDLSETEITLMLQILLKSDNCALDLIDKHPDLFMNQLAEESKVAGMKWDDLVLNFEWTCEIQALLESDQVDDEHKETVREAMVSYRCCFDSNSVKTWLS